MPPLAMTVGPTDGSVAQGHSTDGDQDPPQCLPAAEECRRVNGQAHENIADTVDGEEVVHDAFLGRRGRRLPFKEGEGVVGAQDRVDAEGDAGGGDGGGRDLEAFGLREGHFDRLSGENLSWSRSEYR